MGSPIGIAEIIDVTAGIVSPLVGSRNPFNLATLPDSEVGDGVLRRVRDTQRAVCDLWASNPGGVSSFESGTNQYFDEACRDYLQGQGTPIPEPIPGTDFSGGQCSTRYLVSYVGTGPVGTDGSGNCVGEVSSGNTSNLWGPILQTREQGTNTCPNRQGFQEFQVLCFGSGVSPSASPEWVTLISASNIFTASITSISRVDGQEDNCGDPQRIPGSPITSPVGLPVPPTKWIDSPVTFPVPRTGPGLDIRIPIEIAPDINIDFGNPSNGGGGGYEPPRPGGLGNPDDNPDDYDSGGRPLWGVLVEATTVPGGAGIIPGTENSVAPEIIANITFRSGEVDIIGKFGVTLPVRERKSVIPHNLGDTLVTGYSFWARPGWVFSVTPVFDAREDGN